MEHTVLQRLDVNRDISCTKCIGYSDWTIVLQASRLVARASTWCGKAAGDACVAAAIKLPPSGPQGGRGLGTAHGAAVA